ncbi:hypothetical protein [Trichoplusia ni single nucleopolyhedrovirus]|uniref:Uncharacterized protein n=1 Tax=Trichoplusia ni single nucleopolyhedrovirus TaxID=332054 RepID=Q462B5_9ABAC|nr:hypothetical protein TNSV_gp050 [Trichoplusia ni single nucleopolyhedrovirus]AAZ67421.1 hypothetical protein [Trichoplusia ni single nucleopolyhedrovirus]
MNSRETVVCRNRTSRRRRRRKHDAILRQPDVCHPIRGHRRRLSSEVIVEGYR